MASLAPAVAKKYRLAPGYQAGVVHIQHPKRATVDLTKISLKQADQLVKDGWKGLIAIPKKETEEKSGGSD